jgi:hypothetical protein
MNAQQLNDALVWLKKDEIGRKIHEIMLLQLIHRMLQRMDKRLKDMEFTVDMIELELDAMKGAKNAEVSEG